MTEHPATDVVARTLRLGEAATTPLPNPQRASVHALSREADQVNRLTTENERLRCRLAGVIHIATDYTPTGDAGLAAVFRSAILDTANDSTDRPLSAALLRRMLADSGGYDQGLAEISGQTPGGGDQ